MSVAFAAWCVGWVWGLLELTRPYPGILTFKGTRGAFEVVEFSTGMSATTVLVASFLLLMVIALVVVKSQHWLDPDRIASKAMRWAFTSHSLNAASVFLGVLTIAAVMCEFWFDDKSAAQRSWFFAFCAHWLPHASHGIPSLCHARH